MATFNRQMIKHPVEQLRLVLAVLTFAIIGLVAFSNKTFLDIQSTNPVMVFPYLIAIDIFAIKPWQWLQLATALSTIIIWFKAWSVAIASRAAKEHEANFDWSKVELIRKLSRLRNLTTWLYLFIGFVFTLLYWPEIYNYLPDSWETWLAEFFETDLPIHLGTSQVLPASKIPL